MPALSEKMHRALLARCRPLNPALSICTQRLLPRLKKTYPRFLRTPHNPFHPSGKGIARGVARRSGGAASPARGTRAMRTRRKAGSHGMRNPCAEKPASLSDLPEPCSLAVTERTGSETSTAKTRRRGTRPLRAYCLRHPTPVPGAGRMARLLFRRPVAHARFLVRTKQHQTRPAASPRRRGSTQGSRRGQIKRRNTPSEIFPCGHPRAMPASTNKCHRLQAKMRVPRPLSASRRPAPGGNKTSAPGGLPAKAGIVGTRVAWRKQEETACGIH